MSNYIRAKFGGGVYFFTLVTFNRRPFLTSPLARKTLRFAWKDVQSRYPFEVDAICLLPDHLHCIWRLPENDADFSNRWMSIKAIFSKRYLSSGGQEGRRNDSRKKRGEAAIWQRRFWEHSIRDDSDYARHFNYIHYNPVKHGYVKRPHDWHWSSFHRYLKLGYYDEDWGTSGQVIQGGQNFGE